MNAKPATLVSAVMIAALVLAVLSACTSASPSPSPSKSAASPAASPSSPSPSSPAASSSAKPVSAEEQAYQKAQDNWKKVVEAAQKEGEATLYSVWDPDTLKRVEDGFNKLDPKIHIKLVRMTGPVASERLKAEAASKQYVSSGYVGGSPSTRPMADQGLGQVIDDLPVIYEPGIKWHIPPLFDKPRETLSIGLVKFHVLVNTNLVPAGQEPRTWRDLGDPRWKDKLLVWDPRLAGNGQAVLYTLYNNPEYGADAVRKIVENLRVVPDSTQVPQLVARGEMAVGITPWTGYLTVKDAPVKILSPEDGAIGTTLQIIMVKNAPQPNITKMFANWILGKEGQTITSIGYATSRPDVDALTKETQIIGGKFMPNVPATWDFELTKAMDSVKVFGKWLNDLGK